MNSFKEFKLDDLLWICHYGLPKKKISTEVLLSDLSLLETPVFFLSTGRCGTHWFSKLISKDRTVKDFHSPYPNLSIQNKFMFSLWHQKTEHHQKIEIGSQIFLAGREQHLRFAYKCQRRYFETNNHITFFAPVISKIIPQAKFIHLYRHPGEFVRSGIRRGWYEQNEQANAKLITPPNDVNSWSKFSQIEKIGWLWNETNGFIEQFKQSVGPDRVFDVNINQLNYTGIERLLDFINVSISPGIIKRHLKSRVNVQKSGNFPEYKIWSDDQKDELKKNCSVLSKKYGYQL